MARIIEKAAYIELDFEADGTYLMGGTKLQYMGAPVVGGQFGTFTPIGAETSDDGLGYKVVWKAAGADQYTIWLTDVNGNFTSEPIGLVSGTDPTIEAIEPRFQQDLNGDGKIGLNLPQTVIEADGLTSLVQIESNYFFNPTGSASEVELQYLRSPVQAGQFGTWAPIAVEPIATGYQVLWKVGGADQYTVWTTDNNGNYVSEPVGLVPGNDPAIQSLENSFHQDINGDGVIGFNPTAIDASGPNALVQVANHYFVFPFGQLSGVELQYLGAPVVTGQFGDWAPIAVQTTSGGYEVVWKAAGANQFTMWLTDANGNYVSEPIGLVPGNDPQLESVEYGFQRDLNGDGKIGFDPAVTVIDGAASAALLQVASNYFISSPGQLSVVELKYAGLPVAAGQFGAWQPIGVEPLVPGQSFGYEVVWKDATTGQLTAWNVDQNGNYLSEPIGLVANSSVEIESLEPQFQQDLNGDGVVGVSKLAAAIAGAASVVHSGNNFFLVPNGQFSGVELQFAGYPVVAGQFGTWQPIAAEQLTGGFYQVIWKTADGSQFTEWLVDASGNYFSEPIGLVPGSDFRIVNLESAFLQDLNGDGVLALQSAGAFDLRSLANTSGIHDVTLYNFTGAGQTSLYLPNGQNIDVDASSSINDNIYLGSGNSIINLNNGSPNAVHFGSGTATVNSATSTPTANTYYLSTGPVTINDNSSGVIINADTSATGSLAFNQTATSSASAVDTIDLPSGPSSINISETFFPLYGSGSFSFASEIHLSTAHADIVENISASSGAQVGVAILNAAFSFSLSSGSYDIAITETATISHSEFTFYASSPTSFQIGDSISITSTIGVPGVATAVIDFELSGASIYWWNDIQSILSYNSPAANIPLNEKVSVIDGATLHLDAPLPATISGDGTGTITTDASTLDLSGPFIADVHIASTNSIGTTFKVADYATATELVGGPGQDELYAPTLTLTPAEKGHVFNQGSIEVIQDSTGIDIKPGASVTLPVSGGVTVNGGGAPDTFIFHVGFGADTIKQFNTATDVLEFDSALFPDMNPLAHAVQAPNGNDVIVTLSAANSVDTVTLVGVHLDNLHASNFTLV